MERAYAREVQRHDLRFCSNRLAKQPTGPGGAMARGVDEVTVIAKKPDAGTGSAWSSGPGRWGGASLTRPEPISTLVQSPLGAVAVLC